MTTTPPQPADDSTPAQASAGTPSGSGTSRRGLLAGGAVVAVLVVVGLIWAFVAGPLSGSARQEREIEDTLTSLSAAESFAEFNSLLCAENRVPQDLVDTIASSGDSAGTNLDAMFLESLSGSFPEQLTVTGVEINSAGTEAVATVETGSDPVTTEQITLKLEDGTWTLCQPGVGMGSVPGATQPG